jgi:hypothetical protein
VGLLIPSAVLCGQEAETLNPSVFKETLLDGLGDRVGISVYAFAARFKRFTTPTRDPEKLKSAFDGVFRFSHAGSPNLSRHHEGGARCFRSRR